LIAESYSGQYDFNKFQPVEAMQREIYRFLGRIFLIAPKSSVSFIKRHAALFL